MSVLPALLAGALLLGPPRGLDVVLRIDAPKAVKAGFKPPFKAELGFLLENPGPGSGLLTFQGRCDWADPAKALAYRWKGAVAADGAPRAMRRILYTIRDRDGRTVLAYLGKDPANRIHAESLSGIVLHLTPGTLGEPGGAVDHKVELEF